MTENIANDLGEFAVRRFVNECRKHPLFAEDPVPVMQLVFLEMFCNSPMESWAQKVEANKIHRKTLSQE